jgi:hypothetical protein
MNHTRSTFVISVVSVGMFIFSISSSIQVYALQASSPSYLSTAAGASMPPSSTNPEQHIAKIKIISPSKGQQVSVGKDLTISGTSIDNTTASSTDCKVSVIANKVRPYQLTTATGPGGAADYSKWNFVLTSKYTTIKPGENRITAKYECANNAALTSFSSVNVTGVPSAATNTTNSTTTTGASSTITNPSTTKTTTKPNASSVAQAHTTKIPIATKAESPMAGSKSATSEPRNATTFVSNSTPDLQSKQKNIPIGPNDNTRLSSAVNGTRVVPMQIPASTDSNNRPWEATIAPQVKLIPQQKNKSPSQEQYQPAAQNRNQNISKLSTLGAHGTNPISNIGMAGTQRNEKASVSSPPPRLPIQSPDNYSRSNLLSVSITVGNNPISAGDKQSLTVSVSDAKTNDKVVGAKILGQVTKSSGLGSKGFVLHSDYSGQASYSWKIKQTAVAPDIYKVATTVAAPGYREQFAEASFTVNPSMLLSNTSTGKLMNVNNDKDPNSGDLLSSRIHGFTHKILDDVNQNIKDKWTPRNFILPTPF